jgi:predicted phage terminase large subunit-like protein
MGSANFSAQFLQDPVPAWGNLVKVEWLQVYGPGFNPATASEYIIQSWDCASKDNIDNAWSVCITAHVEGRLVRILDVFRRKLLFPDLRKHAIRLAREYQPREILIEDQSSGTQLIQTLRSESHDGVPWPLPRKPEGDKASRLSGVSAMIEYEQLLLPENAPWLATFKAELLGFPNSRYDDQVDALSQLLERIRQRNQNAPALIAMPIVVRGKGRFGFP